MSNPSCPTYPAKRPQEGTTRACSGLKGAEFKPQAANHLEQHSTWMARSLFSQLDDFSLVHRLEAWNERERMYKASQREAPQSASGVQ